MDQKMKKFPLTAQIFIGLLLGALAGVLLHEFMPAGELRDQILVGGVLNVVGNGFLRAMQMLVVPLVFCSLVCGSMAVGDTKKLGKIGGKILLLYLLTTAVAISLAIGIGRMINPGLGLNLAELQPVEIAPVETVSLTDTLLGIIPKNPIEALAKGEMLQIILFALIVGVILAKLGERAEGVSNFFSQCNDIMMEMTLMVMRFAPAGVFCLIAKTFAGIGFSALGAMLKYMFAVLLALAAQCFLVYMAMLKGLTGLSPVAFLRKFFPVMGFAFSTATSNASIPLSIDTLTKKLGVAKKISSFTIPLGATINMDGTAIMQGVAVVFVAQAYGIPLAVTDYLTVIAAATLASIGTAGVPGVGLITLSMVFASIGLPVEGIGFIMGVDRLLDMARTAVNVTGDAVCTTIVASQERAVDRERFRRMTEHSDTGR